jgi:glycine/serine hydroxymethyltransferase
MKEEEMDKIANWIKKVSDLVIPYNFIEDKDQRKEEIKKFYDFIDSSEELVIIRNEVKEFCLKFPIYV